jgi:hypothetical protein
MLDVSKFAEQMQDDVLTATFDELKEKLEALAVDQGTRAEQMKQIVGQNVALHTKLDVLLSTSPSLQITAGSHAYKARGLVSASDLRLGDEAFAMDSDRRDKRWEREPISWNQWLNKQHTRKDGEVKLQFLTQFDHTNVDFVATSACLVRKTMGDFDGNYFVHGLNQTVYHHDGTRCDDCYWKPKWRPGMPPPKFKLNTTGMKSPTLLAEMKKTIEDKIIAKGGNVTQFKTKLKWRRRLRTRHARPLRESRRKRRYSGGRGKRGNGDISRSQTNPTAWPKIRYWQHTLNHMVSGLSSNTCHDPY